jgi:hypothetical protein
MHDVTLGGGSMFTAIVAVEILLVMLFENGMNTPEKVDVLLGKIITIFDNPNQVLQVL